MELSREEGDYLVHLLLASRLVNQRHHFFNWVQGPLQALIPHEILLCGIADQHGRLLHERFSACRYFRDEHFKCFCRPVDGLLVQMLQEWEEDYHPRLIAFSQDGAATGWSARLDDLELKNMAFHGKRGIDGQIQGYTGFSRVTRPFDAKLEMYMEILLPQLLGTLSRVIANEAKINTPRKPSAGIITAREVEVLAWVREGKSNAEIAQILGLSMWTVKNRVRRSMQKLVARTRGQAVANAISLRLLKLHSQHVRSDLTSYDHDV